MSKTGKVLLSILIVFLLAALTFGFVFAFKNDGDKVDASEALDSYRLKLSVAIENVTKLTGDLELANGRIKEVEKQVTVYVTENGQLKETITKHEQTIVEKDKTITQKEQEIVTKNNTITEYQERVVTLESAAEDNQAEITRLQGEITRLQGEVSSLESEVSQLRLDKNKLQSEVDSLKDSLRQKEQELADLQAQYDALEDEKTLIEININVLNETIIELRQTINTLEEALDKDEDKVYLESVIDEKCSYYFYKLNNSEALLSFYSPNSIYLVNLFDYSVTYLSDGFISFNYSNPYIFNNGDVFFNGDASNCKYWYSLSEKKIYPIMLNASSEVLIVEFDSNKVLFLETTCSDFYVYDCNSKQFLYYCSYSNGDGYLVNIFSISLIDSIDNVYYFLVLAEDPDISGYYSFTFDSSLSSDSAYNFERLSGIDFNIENPIIYDTVVIPLESNTFLFGYFGLSSNPEYKFLLLSLDNFTSEEVCPLTEINYWGADLFESFEKNDKYIFIHLSNGDVLYYDIANKKILTELPIRVSLLEIDFDHDSYSWVKNSDMSRWTGLYLEKISDYTFSISKSISSEDELDIYKDSSHSVAYRLLYLDANGQLQELHLEKSNVFKFNEELLNAVYEKDGERCFDILVCFDLYTPLDSGKLAFK